MKLIVMQNNKSYRIQIQFQVTRYRLQGKTEYSYRLQDASYRGSISKRKIKASFLISGVP